MVSDEVIGMSVRRHYVKEKDDLFSLGAHIFFLLSRPSMQSLN